MTLPSTSVQAELSATLVDEWARAGVHHAVLSPGSRSSALALALLDDARITVHVRLDERSGAFFGIGMALARSTPILIVTTSGTATAELHAAVVEADQARVPLIVVTADRPVELHGVGAPQTIDQSLLFGRSLRYLLDLPVAEAGSRSHWRSFASRLVAEATGGPKGPGPVQLNVSFREPMVGLTGTLPRGREDGRRWHETVREAAVSPSVLDRFEEVTDDVAHGVIILGGAPLRAADAVLAYAAARGWPVIGDGRAVRRHRHPVLIAHADQFLRSVLAIDRLLPECVVHLGSPHASKTLMNWNERNAHAGVEHLFVDPYGSFEDPERYGALFLGADPAALCREATRSLGRVTVDPAWLGRWRRCDEVAAAAIGDLLDHDQLSEPAIARTVFAHLHDRDTLFCSSSMPVRDVEWFAAASPSPARVLANRGANGIDGVVSSVLGAAALSPGRTVGLLGDLALLHDLSGLVWGSKELVPTATLVVIDNAGGGIFSFLSYPDLVDPATFERAFGTPQRAELAEVVRALGCSVTEVATRAELSDALRVTASSAGISVIVARTDREQNVAVHQQLADAVDRALRSGVGRGGIVDSP